MTVYAYIAIGLLLALFLLGLIGRVLGWDKPPTE